MTHGKPTHTVSMSSDSYKNFLDLPRRERTARLQGVALLPHHLNASIDASGFLEWAPRHPMPLHKPPADLIFQFARLAGAPLKQIELFAARWGPLGKDLGIRQHVDEWQYYAGLAQSILRFAAELDSGNGQEQDWVTISKWTPPAYAVLKRKRTPVLERKALLCAAVNKWSKMAQTNGIMVLVADRMEVRIYGNSLFGILGVQMAHVISRSDQPVVCPGCNGPFRPERPPSSGSRQYCSSCRRKKKPQRDAARDYRRRLRSKALKLD
jgi:hypothetical protein